MNYEVRRQEGIYKINLPYQIPADDRENEIENLISSLDKRKVANSFKDNRFIEIFNPNRNPETERILKNANQLNYIRTLSNEISGNHYAENSIKILGHPKNERQ